MKQPMQPLRKNRDGVVRFCENALVRYLLDWATPRGCSLNDLATLPFNNADRCQFAQLIGYSLCGYGELGYVSDKAYKEAEAAIRQSQRRKRR